MEADDRHWTTMGSFVSLQRGHDLTESERQPGYVPVVGSAGPNGFHSTAKTAGPGVAIGRSGASFGVATYCPVDYWPHNTVLYVTDFRGNDPRYVYYCMRSIDFAAFNSGSAQASLNRNYLGMIPVRVPPAPEQRAIAHILGTLDDKIELNRRMNETLEEMARALFKSWFVDFDPVRRKAEGCDPGLPKHLADLFPSRFVDSELGEIPEGWPVATLKDVCEATKGVSYKGSGLADAGMPLHNLNSVYEGGGYKHEGLKHYTGEFADRHVVLPGDLLVANTEQGHDRLLIGYAAIVPSIYGDRGIASHHIYRVRPLAGTGLSAVYLCHLLNSRKMHELVSGYANGTTVNMLPVTALQHPMIVVPPSDLLRSFSDAATAMGRRREQTITESALCNPEHR
jgi:type I restriction enzyme S subunit